LTHFKSANGNLRPSGMGLKKGVQGWGPGSEVGIPWQQNPHVFDDELWHGTDAEKADFFGFEADSGAGDAERFGTIGSAVKRDREAFDLEVAIDARAHEIRLRSVCGDGEEE